MKKNTYIIFVVFVLLLFVIFSNQNTTNEGKINQNEITAVYASLSPQAKSLYFQQSEKLTKPVPERLVELDELTIGCFGPSMILQMFEFDTNLGGQCCGALKDFDAYEIQLVALHSFIEENGNIDLIPRDPYDVSVEHAQKLIEFDNYIVLSYDKQQVYDEAMGMSHHGGPCCCKCWKWYMMSGLGKKLIMDYSWDSEQLAELWDLSSSCGHAEDTNMHQHYSVNPDHGKEHHDVKDDHVNADA